MGIEHFFLKKNHEDVNLNLFKEQINRSYDGHAKDVAYMFLTKCNQK